MWRYGVASTSDSSAVMLDMLCDAEPMLPCDTTLVGDDSGTGPDSLTACSAEATLPSFDLVQHAPMHAQYVRIQQGTPTARQARAVSV